MKEKATEEKREKKNKTTKKESGIVTKESICATFALFSLLLFLILCTRASIFSTLGEGVHATLVGVFGYLAYPLVLGICYLSVTGLIGKRLVKNRKIGWILALCILFLALTIHTAVSYKAFSKGHYLSYCFDAGKNFPKSTVAGWIGGVLAFGLVKLVSEVGALIIFSLFAILFGYIFVVLVKKTPKSQQEEEVDTQAKTEEPQVVVPLVQQSVGEVAPQAQYSGAEQPIPVNPVAYNSNAMPTVNQRPGVQLFEQKQPGGQAQSMQNHAFSPFGNAQAQTNGNATDSLAESYEKSRAFLFGGTPAENYKRNLLFDPTAKVNNRPSIDPTKEVRNTYLPSYTDAYQNSVNKEVAPTRPVKVVSDNTQNSEYFGRSKEAYTTPPTFEPLQPTVQEVSQPQTQSSDYTSMFDRGEDRSMPPPSYQEPRVTKNEPEKEKEENTGYRRHDYMDLFSMSNPNIFGRQEEGDEALSEREFVSERAEELETPYRDGFDLLDDEEPVFDRNSDIEREESVETTRGMRGEDFLSRRMERDIEDPARNREISIFDRTTEELPTERGMDREELSRDFLDRTPPTSMPMRTVEQKPIPAPPKPRVIRPYVRISLDDLDCRDIEPMANQMEVEETKANILSTLEDFKITDASIASVTFGPTVTRYNVTIPRHIAPKKVVALDQSIAISLHSSGVNVYPNYEDGVVSIEVPNKQRQFVQLGCMLSGDTFVNAKSSSLMFAMGKDVANRKIYGDISKMIHLLVAGSSGSGKSVFLGALIISLIYKYSPEELRLILIDPKKTEFVLYNDLPHLMINEIITDVHKTVQSLTWAIGEMNRRYSLFEQMSRSGKYVVNLDQYNEQLEKKDRLPKIVIIIDELADLMLAAKKEIEDRIQNLTQKARAAGIHLIVATQRPSTDVITGVIKSNLPTRVAFYVATDVDSRVILDQSGAQKLLGKGDFLYTMPGLAAPARVQSAFISPEESQRVVNFIKNNNEAYYDEEATAFINSRGGNGGDDGDGYSADGELDPKYIEALRYVILNGSASISLIQRKCSVGYNRAGKIVEWMEDKGYVSPFEGAKSRKVLITKEEFESLYGEL